MITEEQNKKAWRLYLQAANLQEQVSQQKKRLDEIIKVGKDIITEQQKQEWKEKIQKDKEELTENIVYLENVLQFKKINYKLN